MAIIVQKYGGTSVGSLSRIEAVADRVIETVQQGHQLIVVLSAMAGETNRLLNLAHQIDEKPGKRELDVLLSTGEQVSVALLSMALIKRGFSAASMLADQVGLRTNNQFGRARIESIENERILSELEQGRIVILAGFQGRDHENNITTLGRGGSDTTAVAVAAATQAQECQIFTDVDGVYTADPRIVKNAKRLARIDFDEMLEFAANGAKVLQNRAVELAGHYRVDLRVLSSFADSGDGTLIYYEEDNVEKHAVVGVTSQSDIAMMSVTFTSLMELNQFCLDIDKKGFSLESVSVEQVDEQKFNLKLSGPNQEVKDVQQVIEDNCTGVLYTIRDKIAKISVVGVGLRTHFDVLPKILGCLNKEGIHAHFVSNAEISSSLWIEDKYLELAIRTLHEEFDLGH